MSCAKTIMTEIFGSSMPEVVTSSFAASFVMALGAASMFGRLFYATVSDYIGRKNAYFLIGVSVPLALAIPQWTAMVSDNPSALPLVLFYSSTFVIVSFYGGLFSVLPAYLADLFGQRHVGAIHGRALTAWR